MTDHHAAAVGLGAFLALPGFLAVFSYVILRALGTLSVNALGWRADSIRWRGRTLLAAVAILGFFEPLLKREAWLLKRLRPGGIDAEVCEVEVELVSLG